MGMEGQEGWIFDPSGGTHRLQGSRGEIHPVDMNSLAFLPGVTADEDQGVPGYGLGGLCIRQKQSNQTQGKNHVVSQFLMAAGYQLSALKKS